MPPMGRTTSLPGDIKEDGKCGRGELIQSNTLQRDVVQVLVHPESTMGHDCSIKYFQRK